MCLDQSRKWRFRDDRKEMVLNALGLIPGMTVLDAGCGPGSLTRKIATWLGDSSCIIGIDRDTAFIEYAKGKAQKASLKNLKFLEGDVLSLPLVDNYLDAAISHTVIEHVPNREFLTEQKRVCRSGGRVSVMIAQPKSSIRSNPDIISQVSEREHELWAPIVELQKSLHAESMVGKYNPELYDLPALFEKLGFSNIQVDALALPVVPDNYRNSLDQKTAILESYKNEEIENIERMLPLLKNKLSENHIKDLKELINQRYSKRFLFVEKGVSVWDYSIEIVLIISGIA